MKLDWDAWLPPSDCLRIRTIDVHAAGEPLRIVTGGLPEIPGDSILDRRRWMREHLDHLRRALVWEPRGHFDMYGCVLVPAVSHEAQLGVLFLHNEGYSTMCGHGVIGLVTALVETGALPAAGPEAPINLDTPAGLVRAVAFLDGRGRVREVAFQNVPSFVYAHDVKLQVEDAGTISADIVFGGAFYAVAAARSFGLEVEPEQTAALVDAADRLTRAVKASVSIRHPAHEDLGFLYGSILTGPPEDPAHHSRNICVFARSEVDRSPTGTGVSGRVALHAARGELEPGRDVAIESVLGRQSVFRGRVTGYTQVGRFPAVIPEVRGSAFITGRHEFIIDPRDPFAAGFLVR